MSCVEDVEENAPALKTVAETSHFIFQSSDEGLTDTELEKGKILAEEYYEQIASYLGASYTPNEKLNILLEGFPTEQANYAGIVDEFGLIHLRRMPEAQGGYWSVLDHELVHAFRHPFQIENNISRAWENYGFLEEGFAEFLSKKLYPEKNSFSTFGLDVNFIAGYWLAQQADLSLSFARAFHDDINLECGIKIYPIRASWFNFLEERFGFEKVLKLAYTTEIPTNTFLSTIFEMGYNDLDQEWKIWLFNKYESFSNKETLIEQYEALLSEPTSLGCEF